MQQITFWQIWNASPPAFITQNTVSWFRGVLTLWREKKRLNGTEVKLDDYGIAAMRNEQRDGRSGSAKVSLVQTVLNRLMRWLDKVLCRKNTVARPVKLLRIANVRKLDKTADVWCLTVPDSAEFSLANGAVVHNCSHPSDAFRMLAVSWQEISDKTPALEPKPLMVGPQNTVTLNDMWQVHDRTVSRRARI